MFWTCPFKQLFGIPCPGCGTTRAFCAFFKGNFVEAFTINPLGLFVCFLILAFLIAKIVDTFFGTQIIYRCWTCPVKRLRQKHQICYILILLVMGILAILNSFWNIEKGI